ncbi:MAG: hypothetical protein ACJ8HI_19270 [Massilia sp.]
MRLLLCLMLSATLCAVQAEASPVACYAVFVADTLGLTSPFDASPPLLRAKDIRLTSKPATAPWTGPPSRLVMPANVSEQFDYRAAYWQVDKDVLSITWSNNGLSGVEMRLTPNVAGFEGSIASFWDFAPAITDQRRAVLKRRPC